MIDGFDCTCGSPECLRCGPVVAKWIRDNREAIVAALAETKEIGLDAVLDRMEARPAPVDTSWIEMET